MKPTARFLTSRRAPLALLLVVLAAPAALAAILPYAPTRDAPRIDLSPIGSPENQHEEMERLFKQIERRQREIDRLLERASEPSRASQTELAGHLKTCESRGRDVADDIDRILELAGHAHSGSGT